MASSALSEAFPLVTSEAVLVTADMATTTSTAILVTAATATVSVGASVASDMVAMVAGITVSIIIIIIQSFYIAHITDSRTDSMRCDSQ